MMKALYSFALLLLVVCLAITSTHAAYYPSFDWGGFPKVGVTVDVNEMAWILPTLTSMQEEMKSIRVTMMELMQQMMLRGDLYSSELTNQWRTTNALLNGTSIEALMGFSNMNQLLLDVVENKLSKVLIVGGVVVTLTFVYFTAFLVGLAGFACWYMALQQQQLTFMRMKLDEKGYLHSESQTTRSGYQRIPERKRANASAA